MGCHMRTMIHFHRRPLVLTGMLAAVALVTIGAFVLSGGGAEPTSAQASLQGVAPESLARDGIALLPADSNDQANFNEDKAVEFARKARPDNFQVIEVKLLRLAMNASNPSSEHLVWAV